MSINTFSNGEADSSVRTKLNQVITKINHLGDDPYSLAGNYRWLTVIPDTAGGTGMVINTIYFLPVRVTETFTISELFCQVTTGAAGNAQMALYSSDGTTRKPTSTALATTGSQSTASAGIFTQATTPASLQVTPGLYWVAINSDNISCAVLSMNATYMASLIGSATLAKLRSGTSATALAYSLANPGAFGTWPDVTSSTFVEDTNNRAGMLGCKVTSVP